VYLNSQREMLVWELPYLKLKRKIKVRRDDFRVSSFESCSSCKIAVAGTEEGAMQIVVNPGSY
jgi:hypothetical protein